MAAASTASTAIKRKIARLRREIERIDAFFYTNSPDYVDLAWTLELKRDDMVRAIVLQLHTSTEECMSSEHFGQLAWQFKRMSGPSG